MMLSMPFRRSLANVKTDKHEITWSNLSTNPATGITVDLISVVDVGSKSNNIEVAVGAHVKWIYVEFNVAAEDVTNANVFHWEIYVQRADQTITNPTFYYQDNRSQIIKRGMEMLPKDVSTVFKRIFVVKIPKMYQRMKQGSKIVLEARGTSASLVNFCGIAIYKEIY